MRAEQVTLTDVAHAVEDLGFPWPEGIVWETVPQETIYRIAACGFPRNYPHWTFGREYWRLKSAHERGRSRIYEIVLNDDPPVAYLSEDLTPPERVLVQAHVAGHVLLFRRNLFNQTYMPPGMIARAAAARERTLSYIALHGEEHVEAVLDAAHALRSTVRLEKPLRESLQPLLSDWSLRRIDPCVQDPLLAHRSEEYERQVREQEDREFDLFLRCKYGVGERDLLLWILSYIEPSGGQEWVHDLLSVVREQELYHRGVLHTKVIHESFASFLHRQVLRQLDLDAEDALSWARVHSFVSAQFAAALNPYAVGLEVIQLLYERGEDVLQILSESDDAGFFRNRLDEEGIERARLYGWKAEPEPPPTIEVKDGVVPLVRQRLPWEELQRRVVAEMEAKLHLTDPVRVEGVCPGLSYRSVPGMKLPDWSGAATETVWYPTTDRVIAHLESLRKQKFEGITPVSRVQEILMQMLHVSFADEALGIAPHPQALFLLSREPQRGDKSWGVVVEEAMPILRAMLEILHLRVVLLLQQDRSGKVSAIYLAN